MLVRHSVFYLFARGVPGLVGFATVIAYTRLLSPEVYGQYAIVVTGAIVVNAVLYRWISASLLRFLPQYRDNPSDLLGAVLSGFGIVSLLISGVGLVLSISWWESSWGGVIAVGVLISLAQAWFTINLELVRSQLAPMSYGFIAMVKAILALALGVILVFLEFGVYGALVGLLAGFLVAGLWASRGQWKGCTWWRFDRKLVESLLIYGLPLTASFALGVVISSTDRFMLAGLVGERATGLYAAGQVIAQQTLGVLMTMINLASYPIIVKTLECSGIDSARAKLRQNAVLLLGVGLPITVIFVFLSPGIAKIALGEEFQAAGTELMPWFAVATLISGVRSYYYDLSFYLGRRTNVQMIIMIIAASSNIVLNIWLIPIYNLLGAAYASVVALGIAAVLSGVLGRGAFKMPVIHHDVVKLVVAAFAMTVAVLMLPRGNDVLALVVSIVLGMLVYIGCISILYLEEIKGYSMRLLEKRKGA